MSLRLNFWKFKTGKITFSRTVHKNSLFRKVKGMREKERSGLRTLVIIVAVATGLKIVLPALGFIFSLVAGLAGFGVLALVVLLLAGTIKGKNGSESQGRVSQGRGTKSSDNPNFGENKNPYSSSANTYSTAGGSAFSDRVVVDTEAVEVSRKLTAQEARMLNETSRILVDAHLTANRIKDGNVRDAFAPVLDKVEKIIAALKKEPDEITNAKQFISYYVPTIDAVLRKYAKLEQSGIEIEDSKAKLMSFVPDIMKALDKQYDSFFDDDKLDLSVEMEAMSLALKRDGLITTSDYITEEEMEKIELTI